MRKWPDDAQQRWAQLSAEAQQRILDQVWCPHCGQPQRMELLDGTMIADDLVLTGTCAVCDRRVARLLKPDGTLPVDERPYAPGETVIWLKRLTNRFVAPYHATVVSSSEKRVRITVEDEGQQVTHFVSRDSLQRRG